MDIRPTQRRPFRAEPACYESGMLRTAFTLALLLAAAPAVADSTASSASAASTAAAPSAVPTPAPDRATAVSTLAGLYYSADACSFSISRDKVSAYADAARPAGDALFNVDVFRATQALYAAQKGWSPDQVTAWCKTEAATIRQLGMSL